MNREIKFRGKRIDNGEWVYGCLYQSWYEDGTCGNDKPYTIVRFDGAPCKKEPVFHKVNPETVGQFTGLQDKRGKDIYEGDVVECNIGFEGKYLPHAGEVIYDEELCCFCTENDGGHTPFLNHAINTRKIRGNVHETTD